jgi:sigma-B regulation protein RsbU (phosphoserine phosphatase)
VSSLPPVDGADTAAFEDLFEEAPCGYLLTSTDGAIMRVNRTFEAWTGLRREDLVGSRRFQDLLPAPARIYHETHFSPLLRMHGSVKEIASEVVCADGSRLPVLINAALGTGLDGEELVRTAIFDATERRRYEKELLDGRRDEHDIAQKLQQSLLNGKLPSGPQLEVVASYRPAVGGLEVGGDWFDAFWVDDDRIALAIGDVVGRGVEAAATMGQLRTAIRAFAFDRRPPAALLESLDGFARRHGVGAYATVAYAELDLATRELRYACAGHLPPVLIEPDAEPSLLWEGRSTPLTVGSRRRKPRTEAVTTLEERSVLLLYTDGLVERRSEEIDDGMQRLLLAAATSRAATPADTARDLLRALEADEPNDDICMLIAALT